MKICAVKYIFHLGIFFSFLNLENQNHLNLCILLKDHFSYGKVMGYEIRNMCLFYSKSFLITFDVVNAKCLPQNNLILYMYYVFP